MKRVTMTISMPREMIDKIDSSPIRKSTSRSDYVRLAVAQFSEKEHAISSGGKQNHEKETK
ncbi:MAG: hypothetical protein ACM3SR_08075 [Ignavibacteriales bacterium]